jgi:two-component system chemotaxis response regulator CheY
MDLSKLKFLVVDDSAMVRQHIDALLRQSGAARVDQAADGKEALLKIKKAFSEHLPYNMILLDWEMPEMTGIELLHALRIDPKFKDSIVLMISSRGESEQIKEAASHQPNGYIVKPFSDELFHDKISGLLPKIKKL